MTRTMTNHASLTLIGTSAGGVEALQYLLRSLPATCHFPIAIVMHLPENSDIRFDRLFEAGHYRVQEAKDKMPIEPETITFAPPGYHLLIERNLTYALSQDDPVNFSRPAIDILFESAASVYRDRLTAMLLTGANQDGAQGLAMVHRQGGYTIVQDPAEAVVSTMPESALQLFQPDQVLKLREIVSFWRHQQHRDQNIDQEGPKGMEAQWKI